MAAKLVQISVKPKTPGESGLPKQAVDRVKVTKHGVGNDYNNYRMEEKNGTDNRAILLYTTDMRDQLNQEGWPLQNGDLGENFMIDGIRYDQLKVDTQLQIGNIKVQITEICNPCSNLRFLDYVGKEKVQEFIKTMKGRRGWYAKVLNEGTVHQEDTVQLLSRS